MASAASAKAKNMSVVSEVFLSGVPYGVPKAWMDQIVRRKLLADDFDALLMANLSWLARSIALLESITNGLSKVGVCVVSIVGPYKVYGEASKFFADQSYIFVREQRRLRRKHGAYQPVAEPTFPLKQPIAPSGEGRWSRCFGLIDVRSRQSVPSHCMNTQISAQAAAAALAERLLGFGRPSFNRINRPR